MKRSNKTISQKNIQNILYYLNIYVHKKNQNANLALKFLNDETIDDISEEIHNLLYNENLKAVISKKQKNKILKIIQPNSKNLKLFQRDIFQLLKEKIKLFKQDLGLELC